MKQYVFFAFLFVSFLPQIASADASLQLNPLKYEDTFSSTSVRQGYVTVSNSSDTSVSVATTVQGFRQIGLEGNLEFFDDPKLSASIVPGLINFDMGPRESIRLAFTVDPAKLPKGGVFAVIFFRTLPPLGDGNNSYLSESAKVGSLLLLQNGQLGQKIGHIKTVSIPFFQFGSSIHGTVVYENTNRDPQAPSFTPNLTAHIGYLASAKTFAGSLVLPLSARNMSLNRPGSYFGLLPITIKTAESGDEATRFVFACTGWCQYVFLVIIVSLLLISIESIRRRYIPKIFCRNKH